MIDSEWHLEGQRFSFKQRLADSRPLLCAELRPPRRDLEGVRAMEAWIDVYHAVHRLTDEDTVVFLTDNAVGAHEEENLSHLLRNLGPRADRQRIVPFLTLKHPIEYCLSYAERVRREKFPALVVLGGDLHDGLPRCLPHAWQLRERLRRSQPALLLGGWANPYREVQQQLGFIERFAGGMDFLLTQVVSHHDFAPVEAFFDGLARRKIGIPVLAGVFHYRSARRTTLEALEQFIRVPAAGLRRDFEERSLSADEVTAATVRALARVGVHRCYVSNLPTNGAAARLKAIRALAGWDETGPSSGGEGRRG